MSSLRGVSVIVAGAGLAGLTAAHDLSKKGAQVSIVEARDRVGGRVLTKHEPFLRGQHAEAGADLIDESQNEICKLIADVGLRRTRILKEGFVAVRGDRGRRRVAGHQAWQRLGKYLQPEVERFCLAEQRWDGGIASALGRQSVAAWLERARVPREMRDVAVGLRGFFLADPDELSLLALVDQFAEEGPPGNEKMFRIKGGNSLLPERLATSLGNPLNLQAVLRSVRQHARGVTVKIEQRGRLEQIGSDYLICTIPASTLRDVSFDPAMPVEQRDAVTRLKYGAVTKSALQFDRITWRKRGRPRAFGSSLPIGAVWDGNEDQKGSHGILSLMAGGRASDATRQILSEQGPAGIVKELTWLGLQDTEPVAWDSISWEHDQWARGGYAYIDPGFAPVLREWLARPFGRVFFAGEHTSMKWQGYMNGAVESGLRAATEVALAQLSLRSSQ